MKAPRKPTRSSSAAGPHRTRPGEGRAPASRPSPTEQARRAAESWGIAPEEKPAKKGKQAASGGKGAAKARATGAGKPALSPRQAPARQGRAPERETGTGGEDRRKPPYPRARAERGQYAAAPARNGGGKPRSPAPAPVHRVKSSDEPQRIAKLLARAGIASRREIERMIAEGRVALDGAVLDTPATLLTNLSGVTVDGQPVAAAESTRLFLFHKPSGCLTAERDPAGRPTIYDRLPSGLPRLMPVGRLDMTTEGLLLLTNDGELKRRLELPSSGVERTYRARAFGEVSQSQLEGLIEGIEVEGIRYGRIDANLERRTGRNQWIEMKLTEGKNREVRRVLEHLGLTVNRLIRVRYGPFDLADSQPGDLVEIKRGDLDRFLHYLKEMKGRNG